MFFKLSVKRRTTEPLMTEDASSVSLQKILTDAISISHHPNTNMDGSFACQTCPKKFKNQRLLQNHESFAHSKSTGTLKSKRRMVKCEMCVKLFRACNIKLHNLRVHHYCLDCQSQFKSREEVFLHQETNHSKDYFCCEICDTEYFSLMEFGKHQMRSHCQACQKTFIRNNQDMIDHLKVCNPEQVSTCLLCSYQVTFRPDLARHYKAIHPGMLAKPEKKRKSSDENESKRPSKKTRLDIPKASVSIEDSRDTMKCDHCDFRSSSRVTLGLHCKQTHKTVLMKMCKNCSFGTRGTHLREHEKMCKPENVKTCSFCDFRSSWMHAMVSHVKKFHKSSEKHLKYECKKCNYSTFHEPDLYRHSEGCRNIFPKDDLDKHSKKVEDGLGPMAYEKRLSESNGVHDILDHSESCKPEKDETCNSMLMTISTEDNENGQSVKKRRPPNKKDEHDGVVRKCKNCSYSTTGEGNFARHSKRCDPRKVLHCNNCDFKTITSWKLEKHSSEVHHLDKFCCSICDFKEKSKSALNKHLLNVHTKPCFVKLLKGKQNLKSESQVTIMRICDVKLQRLDQALQGSGTIRDLRSCFVRLERVDEIVTEQVSQDQAEYSIHIENGEEDILDDFFEVSDREESFNFTINVVEDWNKDAQSDQNVPIQDHKDPPNEQEDEKEIPKNTEERQESQEDLDKNGTNQDDDALKKLESVKKCINFDELIGSVDMNIDESPLEPDDDLNLRLSDNSSPSCSKEDTSFNFMENEQNEEPSVVLEAENISESGDKESVLESRDKVENSVCPEESKIDLETGKATEDRCTKNSLPATTNKSREIDFDVGEFLNSVDMECGNETSENINECAEGGNNEIPSPGPSESVLISADIILEIVKNVIAENSNNSVGKASKSIVEEPSNESGGIEFDVDEFLSSVDMECEAISDVDE